MSDISVAGGFSDPFSIMINADSVPQRHETCCNGLSVAGLLACTEYRPLTPGFQNLFPFHRCRFRRAIFLLAMLSPCLPVCVSCCAAHAIP